MGDSFICKSYSSWIGKRAIFENIKMSSLTFWCILVCWSPMIEPQTLLLTGTASSPKQDIQHI